MLQLRQKLWTKLKHHFLKKEIEYERKNLMLYYYAYSGHKIGLDRVKKAAALLKGFEAKGVETRLLVNDFRAGLAARDFGIPYSVTIESVQDIDAIAQIGDVVIIDSPEDDRGRLEKYCSEYKAVFRFAQNSDDSSHFGEILLRDDCEDEGCISSVVVDDSYFEAAGKAKKEERTLFFLSDADYDKVILNHRDFFIGKKMELLLGHYFFIKYEDELAKLFTTLYEPEEYTELISSSSHIVTASVQTALEAKASGAEVIFIALLEPSKEQIGLLNKYGIVVIKDLDSFTLEAKEKSNSGISEKSLVPMVDKIVNSILNFN